MSPAGRRTERARYVALLPRGVSSSRLDDLEGTDELGALLGVQSNKRAALTLLGAVPPAKTAADPGTRASLVRSFSRRTSPAQRSRHLTRSLPQFEACEQASATEEAGRWYLLDWARQHAGERQGRAARRQAARRATAGSSSSGASEEEHAAARAAQAVVAARTASSLPRPLPRRVEVLRRRAHRSPSRTASRGPAASAGMSPPRGRAGEDGERERAVRALGRDGVREGQLGYRQGSIYFGRVY